MQLTFDMLTFKMPTFDKEKRMLTFNGEKAKVTKAFEPKFVRTARLIPFPRVRRGNISDTISQLIGPKDI